MRVRSNDPNILHFTVRVFILCIILSGFWLAKAQSNPNPATQHGGGTEEKKAVPKPKTSGAEYSGMYSFLREGEFVQITVEDQGRVIGFVSRYADPEGEGGFLNHFLTSGKIEGNRIEFSSEKVNGISFDFQGTIERGDGNSRGDEDYYTLKGNLVEKVTGTDSDKNKGTDKKTSSRSHEVSFKSFPREVPSAPPRSN